MWEERCSSIVRKHLRSVTSVEFWKCEAPRHVEGSSILGTRPELYTLCFQNLTLTLFTRYI